MKTITLVSLLLGLLGAAVRGEDPKGTPSTNSVSGIKGPQAAMELQAPKKATPPQTPLAPAAPTNSILGKRVTYAGYLTDVARTEKKRGLFNLRAPIDPQKDQENISYYPGTDKVQGIILFSIKF